MCPDSVNARGSFQTPPTVSLRTPRSFAVFTESEITSSVTNRFERVAGQFSDRDALTELGRRVTFAELNATANRLARRIVEMRGQGPGQVALLLHSGVSMIVGVLAALKAGKTAVPLDGAYPLTRQSFVFLNSEADLLVCSHSTLARCRELQIDPASVLNGDELPTGIPESNLEPIELADEPCLLLYTSGSTGQPKGIVQTHRNVLHTCSSYTNTLKISPEDRISHLHSTSFSAGITEVLWGLLNGATVCVWDVRTQGFAGLRDWLTDQRISLFHWVPTIFRQLIQDGSPVKRAGKEFQDIRVVMLGSETVTRRDVDIWKKHFPKSSLFVCRLGSTEASNYRMFFVDRTTRFDGSVVPVGYPFGGKEVLLLDESGESVGNGTVGEIAIRSEYLSPGYWKRPDLNAVSFLPDPEGGHKRIFRSGDLGVFRPDGLLEFLGRKDSQLKIHGQRIEAAEIELALLEAKGIKQVAVTAHVDRLGENYLVAYIVPQNGKVPPAADLRRAVANRLPATMVPSQFVILDSLPLTTSGKLDRKALPAPTSTVDAPSSESIAVDSTVDEITRIVAAIVASPAITPETNLLHLGATSIDMIRILNSLECRYEHRPQIDEFYRNPTIATLSAAMDAHVRREAGRSFAADFSNTTDTSKAPWFISNARSDREMQGEIEYEEGAL